MIHKAETFIAAGRAGSSLHSSGLDSAGGLHHMDHQLPTRSQNSKPEKCELYQTEKDGFL